MNAERKPIRLLVSAGGEKDIAKMITLNLQKALGPTYEVVGKEIPNAKQFLETAQTEPVDIFVIVLNNMIPDATETFPCTSKPGQALQLVGYLKDRFRKPVIAAAGWWPEGMNIHEEAAKVGADYFFVLPPDHDELRTNFLRCLAGC